MDPGAVNSEIEDQGAELALITALVPNLRDRSLIDVGSERGAVATALRDAGLGPAWLVEPYPESVRRLRERFADDPAVHVLDVAVGSEDGSAELHLAHDPSGSNLDAFHTLQPERAGPDLVWDGTVPVRVRSLDSLREAGEIPGRVGLLKVDAEGADADVLRGAASIEAEIVMVEFWGDLPDTLGPCPFELDELRSLVEPLGPRRFVFVRHGPRHVGVSRWETADPAEGDWGNLIFVGDSLVPAAEAALPALDRALRERSERITSEQERAARERLDLIERLSAEADERLEVVERLQRTVEGERQTLSGRVRRALRRGKADPSGRGGPLDSLDDVKKEGGGDRPVERPVIEPDGDEADRASNDLPVTDHGALGHPVDSEDPHLRGVEKRSGE
jgi:FkbM family methyltransferase